MAKGSGTRSGLLWEVERLLNECDELPQVLLMENVPQVICPDFFLWIEFLESKGYKNYYKNINAKDMGVPQNRLRTFMVSLLGDYYYEFPESIPLEKRLKDVLEDKVDEKYYLNAKMINYVLDSNDTQEGTEWGGRCDNGVLNPSIAYTISVRGAGGQQRAGISNFIIPDYNEEIKVKELKRKNMYNDDIKCNQAGTLHGGVWDKLHEESRRVYSADGILPTVHTMGGGGQELKIIDEPRDATVIGGIGEKKSNGGTQWYMQDRIYDGDTAISVCSTFNPNYVDKKFRIRKLTPKECWRLMDFDDEDFEKAQKVNSNAQLYKQAGNSIVVSCLYHIFRELL
jgi:DNA (cytosine-5)-methyltransferase 1